MYVLFESERGLIALASVYDIDAMGTAKTEKEAMEWRDMNPDYRAYKYVRVDGE